MKKLTTVLLVVLGTLVGPQAATAKGPSEAKITGAAIGSGITLKGGGESGGTPLGDLAAASGFFPAVFDTAPDPMRDVPPKGRLGPRYRVTYTVPGPNGVSTIRQDVYPYAEPFPVAYTKPGQTFWDGHKTHGGWYWGATGELKATLVGVGLPRNAPAVASRGGNVSWMVALLVVVALAALALVAGVRRGVTIGPWLRRRSTSTT